jgi:hypothetical protein
MVNLEFKLWAESIFGRAVMEPEPASNVPNLLAKIYGGAYPSYDLKPLPGNKKLMKKAKKN